MRLHYCILTLTLYGMLPGHAPASSENSPTFMTLSQKDDYACLRNKGACEQKALALIQQQHGHEAMERECSACLETYADYEKFSEKDLLAATKCNHFFCKECLYGHLQDSPGACPECRETLDPKNDKDVALVPLSAYRNFWFGNSEFYADYQAARNRKAGHRYAFTRCDDRTKIDALQLMQEDGLDAEVDLAKGQEALLRYHSDHFERLIKRWWSSLKDSQALEKRSPTRAFAAAAFVRIELLSLTACDLPARAAKLARSKSLYEIKKAALPAPSHRQRLDEAAMARSLIEPFVGASHRDGIASIVSDFKRQALQHVPEVIVEVWDKGDENAEYTNAEIHSLTADLADVFYLLWLVDHSSPIVIKALARAYAEFEDVDWQQDFQAKLAELRKKTVFHQNPLVRALLRDLSLLESAFTDDSLVSSKRAASAFCDNCTIL